jgi:hypothetical protein
MKGGRGIFRQEKLVNNSANASCYRTVTYIHIARRKLRYLAVLNEKFLMQLVAALAPQND